MVAKELDKLGQSIFDSRYSYPGENGFSDRCRSVAKHVAACEKEDDREKIQDKFNKALASGDFVPGGRIYFGAGRSRPQLLNCYFILPEDNTDSIGKTIQDMYKISCMGGGIGFNFSKIRPKGDDVSNIKNSAPGSVSVMKMINEIANHVKSGGGRRAALMAELNVDHPDLIEFLHVKLDLAQLNNFNISVAITDEFIEACENDQAWSFKFNNRDYHVYQMDRVSKSGRETINVVALNEADALSRAEMNNRIDWSETFENVQRVELKALELWNKIWVNAVETGDPGIFNISLANRYTNSSYFMKMWGTNPCLTGKSVVALAEGGEDKTIEELANEGKDVNVYCLDTKGKLSIRKMRNPRKTGFKVPVYKVTLDSGDSIDVTENHKFLLRDGTYKEVKDLKNGDSLWLMTKSSASIKDIMPSSNSKSQDYKWLTTSGKKGLTPEHRMISTFHNGEIPKGHVVHHIDYNASNNHISNLRVMSKEDHDQLHAKDMIGDNNPMRRAKHEWSEEKWKDYREKQSRASSGEGNGRFSGVTNDELFEHGVSLCNSLGRRFSNNEWQSYAKSKSLPLHFSQFRVNELGTIEEFSVNASVKAGVYSDISIVNLKTIDRLTEQGYTTKIEDGEVLVEKTCEICESKFYIHNARREVACCSQKCGAQLSLRNSNFLEIRERNKPRIAKRREEKREQQLKIYSDLKFKLGRTPFKKEWEQECKSNKVKYRFSQWSPFATFAELQEASLDYNHKVVSVEFVGNEDVYNGTVDDFHNFFVGGWESQNRFGKKKVQYINNRQCGEIVLESYANCCLGHINLSNMVLPDGSDMDWQRIARTVRVGVRFLDNVLTVNDYPIPECKTASNRTRRIGLGTLGLHHALLKLNIRYGSDKCLEFLDRLYATIRDESYLASMYLAREKGSFTEFDAKKFLAEEFAKTLPARIRMLIKENGIRNCHINCAAPCGTISMVHGTSTGIEPIFAAMYKRRWREGNAFREQLVLDPMFKQALISGEDVTKFVGAYDVTPEEHMAVQATIQRYIDNAISKTINLPEDANKDPEKIAKMALKFAPYLKGLTIYRAGSKGTIDAPEPLQAVPLTPENIQIARDLIAKEQEIEAAAPVVCTIGGECGG